jgi:cell division protease FtsH
MGGRVAEELIFGHDKVTSGASSDIKMATNMARAMATQYGMSDKLGPLAYGENEEEVFLGHSVARSQNLSDETQKLVDEEVHKFVEEGYEKAREILNNHIDELHIIGKGLLEYETLTGKEIRDLLDGKPPVRDLGDDSGGSESAVPSAGNSGRKDDGQAEPDDGGLEPQPG